MTLRTTLARLRDYWPALVVLFVSLAATIGVSLRIRHEIDATRQARFINAADRLEEAITSRINTYIAMLEAGTGLLAASEDLTRDEFHRFVERLQLPLRYPGIQGIGYTVRLAPAEVPAFVARQRRQGRETFQIWPADPRDEYHTIAYLEPLDVRNLRAIGYDMSTEPTRRAAMERARDTGRAAASGRVTLVQEIDSDRQPGFLIYVPVYARGEVPATVEERRARLVGFMYSPFRARDLFAGIFGVESDPRAGFELYDDRPDPGSLLIATSEKDRQHAAFVQARQLDVAGRSWSAVFFSTRALEQSSETVLVPFVWASGLAVSLFLTGLTLLQIRARQRVERSEAIVAEASERFRQQAETLETANRRISELLEREHEARAEAERAGREKDEFLATLSHELRTPLAAVLGWSDLLAAGLPPDQAGRALAAVRRNARAQLQLVDDLLDMSRIAGGRMRLEPRDIDPREVVEGAVTVTRPAAEAKRVRVETDLPPDIPLLRADPTRLQQVAWNLLTNAIKFTPASGIVRVSLAAEADQVVLTVADSGSGIDPEFLPHVFDRFRQADASTTRRVGGLGLGLSIVRHLVEMHGGTVEAQSDGPGRGATFIVRLPRVAEARISQPPARVERRLDTTSTPISPRMLAGLRILAVDDERDTRDMIHTVLAQHGADVTSVGSAAEALALLDDEMVVDIIISDLSMPEMDGLELMRRVRQLPRRNRRTAAVALSAFARPEDQSRAILAGFDVHLPKPFEIPALVTTCAALVERARRE